MQFSLRTLQTIAMNIETNTRLKTLILALGITQREFCERTGIGISTLSQYATGERAITDRAIYKIGENFANVNTEWLRSGSGSMFKDNPVAMAQDDEQDQEEIDLRAKIEEQKREIAVMSAQLIQANEMNKDLVEVLKKMADWKKD